VRRSLHPSPCPPAYPTRSAPSPQHHGYRRNHSCCEILFLATGDSGNGMTHGTIAGMLLTDLSLGRENPWAVLSDPSRKTLRALQEFAREKVNVALQYTAWTTAGEVDTADAIPPGTGATIRRRLGKVAIYRDDAGAAYPAECPHLAGVPASANMTSRVGRRSPCSRGRPRCPGSRAGGGSSSAASRRNRVLRRARGHALTRWSHSRTAERLSAPKTKSRTGSRSIPFARR
jgi:hypothetical protein